MAGLERKRYLVIGVSVLLLAAGCAAQQPPEIKQTNDPATLAVRWLDSADPRLQAWAIYLIRHGNLENLTWRVEQLVAQPMYSGPQQKDREDVQLAALDALIQMNVSLPAFELQDLAERFPTEVLILAARSPGENVSVLLNLFDRAESYEAYVAVGNFLATNPTQQFVQRLMASLYIHLYAAVFDLGVNGHGIGGGWAGDAFGVSRPPKKNWPEIGRYELTEFSEGSVLLSPGRHPIYYRRTESKIYTDRGFCFTGESSGHSRNDRAQEYLAQILGFTPKAFPLQINRTLSLYWKNGQAFKEGLTQSLVEQKRIYFSTATEFVKRGLLDADEAGSLQPKIFLSLSGYREHNHDPLPDITDTAAELNVTLVP